MQSENNNIEFTDKEQLERKQAVEKYQRARFVIEMEIVIKKLKPTENQENDK